jgi:hypothetical protein
MEQFKYVFFFTKYCTSQDKVFNLSKLLCIPYLRNSDASPSRLLASLFLVSPSLSLSLLSQLNQSGEKLNYFRQGNAQVLVKCLSRTWMPP